MVEKEFKFYKPCELLQPYVRYYWVFESRRQLNAFTFPIGCTQIIFHKRSPLYIPELDVVQDRVTVSGQVDFSSHLYADGNVEMIVAVFRPHAMKAFLHVPTSLFYNREVAARDLEDRGLNDLAARIFECGDNDRCVTMIEEWLLSRIAAGGADDAYNIRRIGAAIDRICAAPQTSVTDLALGACLSRKQFERLFDTFVGITPKHYTRIVRFQRALRYMQLQTDGINHARTACESGYADQSHMIREFKRLCGYTPAALLKMAVPYSDLFTDPV